MVKRIRSVVKDDRQVWEIAGALQTIRSRKKPRGGRRGLFFDVSNLGKLGYLTHTTQKRSKAVRTGARKGSDGKYAGDGRAKV